MGIVNSSKGLNQSGFTFKDIVWLLALTVIAVLLLASVIISRRHVESVYVDTDHYDSDYNEAEFDYMLEQIKRDGNKVTYANRNTGTISYRDQNNEVRSVSVYRGYNSHWKDTKDKYK